MKFTSKRVWLNTIILLTYVLMIVTNILANVLPIIRNRIQQPIPHHYNDCHYLHNCPIPNDHLYRYWKS